MPSWNPLGRSRDYRRSSSSRRLIFISSLLAITALIAVSAFQFLRVAPARAASPQVTFPVSRPAVVKQSRLLGNTDPQQRVSLSIGLRVPNESGLTQYVQDISRPGSVNFHRYLTPAQYEAVFSPSQTNYNAVEHYLQTQGFTITHTYNNRLLIAFSGTIAQVNAAFGVTLKNYTAPDGHSFYANDTNPLLPAWLAGEVQSIAGLNNAVHLQHPPLKAPTSKNITSNPQTTSCPGHDTHNPQQYLTADQIATAYNLTDMYNAGFQGEGQSVALFELDTFNMSDLTNYAACYGHSHTPIQKVVAGSSAVSSDSGIVEVELDAQLILSAAPKLGRLVIYESGNDEADRLAQWAQIVQDAVPVVSTSWGDCELNMDPTEVQQENILFTAAAAQGQSVFAASGDSGSAGCAFDTSGSSQAYTGLNAGDPGAQPFVTGVGGTTLSINSSTSAYTGEVTWNNAPSGQYSGGASGGGISQYWTAPSWQNGPGVNNSYSSGVPCNASSGNICRETPDVSLHADPNNGYLIYCTPTQAGCDPTRPWNSIGGTSAAAPMWAAMMALTNEMSVRHGDFNLGFVNPMLYEIANNPSDYANSFHDITSGNDDYDNLNSGKYPAINNYDMATGLGSYKAYGLATKLVALADDEQPTRVSPANTTWYFAEGSVGNSFQEYLTLQNPSTSQSATVNITYLFEGKPSVVVTHVVPASSRATVSVNHDLGVDAGDPQQALSAIVQVANGGPAIVAERPMYFSYDGIRSGTDVMGATNPQSTYYFPSVDSRAGGGRLYLTYLTMLNPSATQTSNVTVTYYTGSCGLSSQPTCPTQTVTIAPLHRGTATPLALHMFLQTPVSVQADHPVVVERPTYFKDTIANAGGATTGAASEVGATTPGKDWLFAEGYTGTNFQEYLTLANFGTSATSAVVTLEYDNGHKQAITVSVPALGRIYFDVNHANASPSGTCDINPCSTSTASSAEVTSTSDIVVDRLMYFHKGSARISGATEAVGEAGPAKNSVYAFAEGYTAGSFDEYLTLQNPTGRDETVAVTLFVDTYVLQVQAVIKAQSRKTISINSLVVPIAQAYNNMGSDSYSVSLIVQTLNRDDTIVAERPMYFNFYGDPGGTDVIGYAASTHCPSTSSPGSLVGARC